MKLHWILVFVALSCVSNGHAQATENNSTDNSTQVEDTLPFRNDSTSNHTRPSFEPGSQKNTSQNVTETPDKLNMTTPDNSDEKDNEETAENITVSGSQTTTSEHSKTEYVTVATSSTPALSDPAGTRGSPWWGYVILFFIIVLIIVLCVILFYLRRVSRTYSFDLHRPSPRMTEPIGTFEPVYLDDLDRQIHTIEPSDAPVVNGTTLNEDKGPSGEAPQEEPQTNGLQTSLTSDPSPTAQDPDQDQLEPEPELDMSTSPDLFIEETREEQRNENNNNPSTCSSEPFVEINLDEPQWLLTAPQASSSVRPFSSFSFSSSSSSS